LHTGNKRTLWNIEIRNLGKKKKRCFFLVGIRMLVWSYLAFYSFSFNVYSEILENLLSYIQDFPVAISRYFGFLYITATAFPPFFTYQI
jgi:hypothetical protein